MELGEGRFRYIWKAIWNTTAHMESFFIDENISRRRRDESKIKFKFYLLMNINVFGNEIDFFTFDSNLLISFHHLFYNFLSTELYVCFVEPYSDLLFFSLCDANSQFFFFNEHNTLASTRLVVEFHFEFCFLPSLWFFFRLTMFTLGTAISLLLITHTAIRRESEAGSAPKYVDGESSFVLYRFDDHWDGRKELYVISIPETKNMQTKFHS